MQLHLFEPGQPAQTHDNEREVKRLPQVENVKLTKEGLIEKLLIHEAAIMPAMLADFDSLLEENQILAETLHRIESQNKFNANRIAMGSEKVCSVCRKRKPERVAGFATSIIPVVSNRTTEFFYSAEFMCKPCLHAWNEQMIAAARKFYANGSAKNIDISLSKFKNQR